MLSRLMTLCLHKLRKRSYQNLLLLVQFIILINKSCNQSLKLTRYSYTYYRNARFPFHLVLLYPAKNAAEIHLFYPDALELIRRRFFCIQEQHTLGYEDFL